MWTFYLSLHAFNVQKMLTGSVYGYLIVLGSFVQFGERSDILKAPFFKGLQGLK